jgi:excisionase family DNA binding protein
MEDVMTKEQLAEYLKISVKTVDRLRKEGMPSFKVLNMVRFSASDVLEWLKARDKKD